MSSDASHLATVRQIASELESALTRLSAESVAPDSSKEVYEQLAEALDGCLNRLRALDLWGPDNRLFSSEIWNRCGPWLCRGWLQNQARTRPRGYAGDYQMLARIYRGELCDDPLGRLFDRYFQAQAAPRAVRYRMEMTAYWIIAANHARLGSHGGRERPLRIAIVGSAVGLEVRDALLRLREEERASVQVTLLDLDPAAIEFAQQQLQPLVGPAQLVAVNTNLFRLPNRPDTAALLRGADLIVCPGLFDYLPDTAAAAMLRTLYDQLAPAGRLMVFQFAPHNPTRAYMEWIANWYLVYRDAPELCRLVETATLPGALAGFGAEPLGIDLFVTVTRQAGSHHSLSPQSRQW